jgi:hypothetical protein
MMKALTTTATVLTLSRLRSSGVHTPPHRMMFDTIVFRTDKRKQTHGLPIILILEKNLAFGFLTE